MNDRERQLMGILKNNNLQQSNVSPRFSGYDVYNPQPGRLRQSALNILDSRNDYPSHRAVQSIQEQNKLLANLNEQIQTFKNNRLQEEHFKLLHQINKQKLLTEIGDEDQFNQARKIQIMKPPPIMPYMPTIYPYYNYQQPYQLYQQPQQQQQLQQQSKPQVLDRFLQLQMIKLMKSLNQSFSSEDSEKERQLEKRKKKNKKPSVVESLHLQSDIDQLKQLQQKRAKQNWRILLIQYRFLLAFRRRLSEIIERRKTESIEKLLSLKQKYYQSSQEWLLKSCKVVIEILEKKTLNINVVSTANQRISESNLSKNSIKLKEIVQLFVENICQNRFALNETILYILATLTQQYEHIANDFLLKFELNRYKFTHNAAILECPKEMILITWIWFRSGIWQFLGQAFQDFQIEVHFRQNLKIVYSIVYHILIKYIISISQIQENNQSHILANNRIIENIDFYLDITYQQSTNEENTELQESKNQNKDLPILYPVFNENQLSKFIENNGQFIDKMVEMIKNWCKETLIEVEQFHQNVIVKGRYDNLQKDREGRKIKKEIYYLFLNRMQDKILLGKDIAELKAKIVQKNQLLEKRKEQLLNKSKSTKSQKK